MVDIAAIIAFQIYVITIPFISNTNGVLIIIIGVVVNWPTIVRITLITNIKPSIPCKVVFIAPTVIAFCSTFDIFRPVWI
jgi:hypothetical protein